MKIYCSSLKAQNNVTLLTASLLPPIPKPTSKTSVKTRWNVTSCSMPSSSTRPRWIRLAAGPILSTQTLYEIHSTCATYHSQMCTSVPYVNDKGHVINHVSSRSSFKFPQSLGTLCHIVGRKKPGTSNLVKMLTIINTGQMMITYIPEVVQTWYVYHLFNSGKVYIFLKCVTKARHFTFGEQADHRNY